MLIDAHTHVFFPDVIENRDSYFDDEAFASLYRDKQSRLSDVSQLQTYMQETETQTSFCFGFPWQSVDRCLIHNEYLLNITDQNLITFASFPSNPTAKLDTLFTHTAGGPFTGIGELAFYKTGMNEIVFSYLRDIFIFAEENNLIVSLHVNEPVGHEYPGKYITPFDKLYELLCDFSNVDTILAHWGGGFFLYELMNEVRKSVSHVYYDTAASPYLYRKEVFLNALNSTGKDKILFGTDYPLLKAERYISELDTLNLNSSERNSILYSNSYKLLQKHR